MLMPGYDRWKATDPRYERTRYGDPLDDGDASLDRKRERSWDDDEELDTDAEF